MKYLTIAFTLALVLIGNTEAQAPKLRSYPIICIKVSGKPYYWTVNEISFERYFR